ncbi:3-hydroxyacyl-CoA dehydrogenase family protein [Streptomyces polyrhachis]|uniref:3-hydroxyacyl-CoA dehydrogenase family protein n=1 Tax=Streptomyces polyrhachis TaxID=1282885 RepID=A0ABW2GIF7_9ACTN
MAFTLPTAIESRPVAVIGAGTLGRRIALMFCDRGGEVRICDPSKPALEDARAYVDANIAKVAAKVGGTPGRVDITDSQKDAVADAWLVIEAVPEHLDLKRDIFGKLDALAEPDAILASNSSSYASSEFIDNVKHPERVLNMHFYMPPLQNALDMMSDGHTDPAIFTFLEKVLPQYGLHPFLARKESTGFIFNRIWAAIKREALEVVAEGVSTPQDVDAMWRINMGTPAGPFLMMDHVGLDVVLDIESHYAAENPNLPKGPRELLKKYVDAGHLGVKTGQGFYMYGKDGEPVGPGDTTVALEKAER